jgi:hypothetical protein
MLAKVYTCAVIGLDAQIVEVEVDTGRGLPAFFIVGLPDAAVKESRERVRSAIKNSGLRMHDGRITVNLAPADLRKAGLLTICRWRRRPRATDRFLMSIWTAVRRRLVRWTSAARAVSARGGLRQPTVMPIFAP